MTDDDKVKTVIAALEGQFYVGQRVRISAEYGSPLAGVEVTVVRVDPKLDLAYVEPKLFADGGWHYSWLRPA